MSQVVLKLNDVKFSYRNSPVLIDIPNFEVKQGQRLFLYGPSGCGKTTLLGLISGILEADSGEIQVLNSSYSNMRGRSRDAFRGDTLGYIFQMFNLIPYLSVRENIALPCRISSKRRERTGNLDESIEALARRLGISELLDRLVTGLSVGQQQRVAAARALIGNPAIIIADEPTSALDWDHREKFLDLLFEEVERSSGTLIFVSHDQSLKPMFPEIVSLVDLNKASRKESCT